MKNSFLSIFFAATFSLLSFILTRQFDFNFVLPMIFFISSTIVLNFLLDRKSVIYFAITTLVLMVATYLVDSFYVIDMHIALLFFSLYLLYNNNLITTFAKLGFPGNLRTNLIYTFGGLAALFIAGILLNSAISYFNFNNDVYKVVNKVTGFPWYILAAAVFLAPLSEELFFRGFLAQRFGIIVSSILFALSHLAYGSQTELVGAFVLGLVFATVYKYSKSITPCILMHMVYNFFAILVIGSVGT